MREKKRVSFARAAEQPRAGFSLPGPVEVFLAWLDLQKGSSPATGAAYRRDLEQFENWLRNQSLTLAAPGEVRKRDIERYSAFLFREGRARSSISRKLSAIRSFFRYLLRKKLVSDNPTAGVRNPKQQIRQPGTLNVDQVFSLLDEAAVHSGVRPWGDSPNAPDAPGTPPHESREGAAACRDQALVELLYGSGLRISEALGLNVMDVDPSSGVVRVLGKGGKERLAPLSATSMRTLERWLRTRPLLLPAASVEQAVFVGNRGGRLDRRQAARILEHLRQEAGLPQHVSPCLAAFFCHASAGGRGRLARRAGIAWPCPALHHPALHPCDAGSSHARLRQGAPAFRSEGRPRDGRRG